MRRFLHTWRRRKHQVLDDREDFLLLTWDSCRYDAYLEARTPVLDTVCRPRRAWAMATYTLPAHLAMYHGFLPHAFAPEPLYNRFHQQLWRISHRSLDVTPLVTFPLGTQTIIAGFRDRGYFTLGLAAMDWFRDAACLREGFCRFIVTGTGARRQHDLFCRLIRRHAGRRPLFALINYGETHSPFRHADSRDGRDIDDGNFSLQRLFNQRRTRDEAWDFDRVNYRRQVECAEYLDAQTRGLLEFLVDRGRPTTVVLCADHGECFGEQGLYGHAIYHEKVMEVPLLIFRLNAPPHARPASAVESVREVLSAG